jgi:hypothetical protein
LKAPLLPTSEMMVCETCGINVLCHLYTMLASLVAILMPNVQSHAMAVNGSM